ncbi:MAG TPA: HEAT repeat domain-containing protein [Planctomycetota bacterium]|nr:HEAT repeat domain-containing protein [Planctomycetota bacterium]
MGLRAVSVVLAALLAAEGGVPGLPDDLRRRLEDPDPKVRSEGLKLLRGKVDEAAARAVVPFLDDPDAYCRDYAAVMLLPKPADAAGTAWILERAPRASTPAGRLAAADALAAIGGPAAAPGLARLLGDRDARVRTTALDGLARTGLPADPTLAARCRAAIRDPDPGVRAAALEALAAWGEADAEAAAARALADPAAVARSAAAALAARRFPALFARSFPALAADADWGVRAEAARGATSLAAEPPIDLLAGLLEDPRLRIRDLAHDALRGITGVDLPPGKGDWLEWWTRNRAGWKGAPAKPRPAARDSVAAWHGLPFRSDAVLFVVDLSGSMEQPSDAVDGRPRIAIATEELNRTLNALPDAARADVLAFMLEPARALGKIQPLAGGARARLAKWFERRPRGQRGDPGAALPAAILDGEADTLLFLGDGAASAGDCLFRERIRERVRQALRLRPVLIHAVAFGSRPLDRAFLEEVAESTGGRCIER